MPNRADASIRMLRSAEPTKGAAPPARASPIIRRDQTGLVLRVAVGRINDRYTISLNHCGSEKRLPARSATNVIEIREVLHLFGPRPTAALERSPIEHIGKISVGLGNFCSPIRKCSRKQLF